MKFFTSFLLFICSASALAMEIRCDSPESFFKKADIVFVGNVIGRAPHTMKESSKLCWTIEQGSKCGAKKATILVERILKGNSHKGDELVVIAGDACYCVSPYLNKGEKYLVFGLKTEKQNQYSSMNACATAIYNERYLDMLPIKK